MGCGGNEGAGHGCAVLPGLSIILYVCGANMGRLWGELKWARAPRLGALGHQ